MAQRRLAENSAALGTVFERLSSGQRINRASDDAAGLAVSTMLRSDSRVFTQALRNANDGISLLNITDGALDGLSGLLIRIQELSEQSANGVYSSKQRSVLNLESTKLVEEYNRIINSTEFNNLKTLNRSIDHLRLQVGYGINGSIAFSIGNEIAREVGTGTFQTSVAYSLASGVYAQDVTTGDFNNDGITDMATADGTSETTSIFLGNGNGTFKTSVDYDVANNGPYTIETADLNGDGRLDIVTQGFGGLASVLIGNGNGTFKSALTFTTNSGNQFSLRDVDNDGKIDIIAADTEVSVLIGVGDGTFKARVTYQLSQAGGAVVDDFNGDGILDIATNGTSHINLLLGAGDGTFLTRQTFNTVNSRHMVAGDLNKDGNADLVLAEVNSPNVVVRFGTSSGTFQSAVTYAGFGDKSEVALGDLNGDNYLDIVSGDNNFAGTDTVSVFLNTGTGTFSAARSYAAGDAKAVALGDFNGNGVLDIVAANGPDDTLSVLLAITDRSNTLAPIDISTQSAARAALETTRVAIEKINRERGNLGSVQSRLGVAIANLQAARINYDNAASRIVDADIAKESAELVRLNILQQASGSVLSQANQNPALALTLLSS